MVYGYVVAVLAEGYVLHMIALNEVGYVQQLDGLFDPIYDAHDFSDVEIFCKDLSQLKCCVVDKSKLDGNGHGIASEDIRDLEYIFVGLPTLSFLDSLILDKESINFDRTTTRIEEITTLNPFTSRPFLYSDD
ncbi:hypothetical protein ACFX13_040440 [Malus domestica]